MSRVNPVPMTPSRSDAPSSAGSLQAACATIALFLLPFPALNFGVSFTLADVFLVTAVLLNATQLVRLQASKYSKLRASARRRFAECCWPTLAPMSSSLNA